MTGPAFYPEQGDHETGAEYFARVHGMCLPYPWETSKAVPGPITVDWEWSTRASTGPEWIAPDEEQARRQQALTGYRHTLHRRRRWTVVGDWEQVK